MFEQHTALVVDHALAVEHLVEQMLRTELKFGKVLQAPNGKQALELFYAERIDWIFSASDLPDLSGLELLTAIRKHPHGRELPFILMTAHADPDTVAKLALAGNTDFIAKPLNPISLISKIRRMVGTLERRVAERVAPPDVIPCRLAFSSAAIYAGELINISQTGCLVRTVPFCQGGAIFDSAAITLKLGGTLATLKASLVRTEANRSTANARQTLAAFHFTDNDTNTLEAVRKFVAQFAFHTV